MNKLHGSKVHMLIKLGRINLANIVSNIFTSSYENFAILN
jgi:hypothetical protein